MALTVAFLGLGNMGGPMAANLVSSGLAVVGFDPAGLACTRAREGGASIAASAAEAVVGADVVITMLPSGDAVQRCYREILPAVADDALLIDSSTISVDDARAIHRLATDRGLAQIDAPVSGGVKGAAAGSLAFMVGGSEDAFAACQSVLTPMAGKIIHCGDAGSGQAAKVCNNMVLAAQQIVVGEAFVLAEKLGLSAQSLYDVMTGATGNCWAVSTNCPVSGPVAGSPSDNDFRPGFSTALMAKDLGLAMDAVASSGAHAPIGTHAAQMYSEFAVDNAHLDFSAIIETLR